MFSLLHATPLTLFQILGLGQSLQHLDIKGCELLSNAIFAGGFEVY
jgi:hypothetical protein